MLIIIPNPNHVPLNLLARASVSDFRNILFFTQKRTSQCILMYVRFVFSNEILRIKGKIDFVIVLIETH